MIERLRRMSYFLAYTVATIPLWHYIRNGRILALMIAVVTFAYVMIVLSSVQAAQPILSSEKTKTAFPRWLPDRPKYHKWWMLVRRTLKWHLLLVIPKMGLALGFTNYFYSTRANHYNIFLRNYDYHSYGYGYGESLSFVDIPFSQPLTYILGFLTIVIFTILEAQLVASVINKLPEISSKKLKQIIAKRTIMLLSVIGIVFLTAQYLSPIIYDVLSRTEIPCQIGFEYSLGFRNPTTRCASQIEETVNTALNTIIGQGILLALILCVQFGKVQSSAHIVGLITDISSSGRQ